MGTGVSIVVPTVGRPSLSTLLEALAPADGVLRMPLEVILVDDRRDRSAPLVTVPAALAPVVTVVAGRAAGPAAARNVGWRAAAYPWIAFLDDDVVPLPDWLATLEDDLDVDTATVGVQGVIDVPLPADRRPTDWERVTGRLADGRWITADMAYRREALAAAGGFDERFPRAFREDAEVAYRLRRAGGELTVGRRRVTHPVRPENFWVSLRTQAGNADDALLRRLYGPRWRELLEAPPGRRRQHAVVTSAALIAAGAAVLSGRSRLARRISVTAGAAWLAGTVEFAVARIAPGPRTAAELTRMAVTSALIPPYAMAHWLRGWLRARRVQRSSAIVGRSVSATLVCPEPPVTRPPRGSCPTDRIGAHG